MDIPLLCALCFSKDRILYSVTNNEFDLFNTLSPENREFIQTFQTSSSLKLCFECRGRLRRLQKFIEMLQQSLKTLLDYCSATVPIPLTCSSKLALSETKFESILPTMEVKVENYHVKVEALEHEEFDTTLNSSCITDKTENVHDNTENYNLHNTEKVFSVPLLSCVTEKVNEDDDSMYFIASNSVKIEMTSDAEDNDLDSGEIGDDFGETYVAGLSPMQTNNSNSEDQNNSKDQAVVARKKRSPKHKMWLLIETVWLSTEQALKSYLSEIEQENLRGNRELCHRCQRSFKRKEDLTLHVLSNHEVLGATLECGICEYKFTKPIHLHRHVREHYLLYKCKMCDYETRYLHKMKIHTNEHELPATRYRRKRIVCPKGYPHRCYKCKNFFGSKKQLQEHSQEYGCYPNSSICDVCLKLFKNRDKYMHSCTYREKECPDCHQKFKTLYFKRQHDCPHKANVERKHFFCKECDKEFKNRKSYHHHITISQQHVSPKERLRHECPHCDSKFNTRPHLQRHITNIHLRRSAFKCAECPKLFVEREHLLRHESRYHDARNVRDNICHVCGKAFEMQCYLRDHMRMHTEEQPFKCDICGDTFMKGNLLRSHKRVKHPKQKSRLKPRKSPKRKELAEDTTIPLGRDIHTHFVTCGVSELSNGERQMEENIE